MRNGIARYELVRFNWWASRRPGSLSAPSFERSRSPSIDNSIALAGTMPFRELFSNLAIRRKDRKLKNSGEVDNNDQIDSTSASSPSRPRTTKNSSADSSNI